MINLNELFASGPIVTLIEPRAGDSRYLRSLRLLLRDNATGALTELTIEADMVTLPDEALLVLSVMEVEGPRFTGDDGEWVDDGQSSMWDEAEPRIEWRVTPRGEEIDLRRDGLFG